MLTTTVLFRELLIPGTIWGINANNHNHISKGYI